jgi:hypothetical protein
LKDILGQEFHIFDRVVFARRGHGKLELIVGRLLAMGVKPTSAWDNEKFTTVKIEKPFMIIQNEKPNKRKHLPCIQTYKVENVIVVPKES